MSTVSKKNRKKLRTSKQKEKGFNKKINIKNQSTELKRKFSLYTGLIFWLIKDVFSMFPLRVVKVSISYTIGVTSGTAVIGFIFLYIRQFAQSEPFNIFGFQLPIVEGIGSLPIALLIAILGCAAATCSYFSEWAIVNLAVDYQCKCQHRLFKLITRKESAGWAVYSSGPAQQEIMKLQQQTLFVGRAVRILLRLVWPLLTFIVSISSLVILDYKLTLLLIPLCLLYSIPLYKTNIHAARSKKIHAKVHTQTKAKVNQLIKDIVDGSLLKKDSSTIDFQLRSHQPDYVQTSRFAFKRLLVGLHTEFLNTILLTLGIFVLFSFAIIQSYSPNWSWSEFILYIVSFRFVATGLKRVTANLILISRLTPDIRNYVEFTWKMQNYISKNNNTARQITQKKNLDIRTLPALIKSNKKIERIELPGIIEIFLPYQPNIVDLQGIARKIEVASNISLNKDNIKYLSKSTINKKIDKKQEGISNERQIFLESAHKKIGTYEEYKKLVKKQTPKTTQSQDKISKESEILLKSLDVFLSERDILFIECDVFNKIRETKFQQIQDLSQSKIFAIINPDIKELFNSPQKHQFKFIIIYDSENQLIACGDIENLKQAQSQIEELWNVTTNSSLQDFLDEEE